VKKNLIVLVLSISLLLPNISNAWVDTLVNVGAAIFSGIEKKPKSKTKKYSNADKSSKRRLKKQNQEVKNCVKKLNDTYKNLSWKLYKCNATD
jgi:hypothetical protein